MQTVSNKSKISIRLSWLCLCAGFAVTIGFYALYGQRIMDSDQASELILADLLNHEKGLLSKNWFYSTELRVLNCQIVYRIGLALFSDWHAAATFSLAIMLLILISTYLFLAKATGCLEKGIWTAVILTLPFSRQYTDYFLFGGYYIPHLAISFASVGLMLHMSAKWGRLPIWKRIAEILLLAGLCTFSGMGGIRGLLICYFPMIITAGVFFLIKLFNRKTAGGERPRIFIFSSLALLSGLTGYIINRYLLANGYSAASYSGFEVQTLTLKGIRHMFAQAAWSIGWNGFPGETPMQTLQSVMAIVLVLTIIGAYICGCRRWHKLTDAQKFMMIYFPVGCVLVLFACVLTGNKEARFLLPSILYFPCILQIGLGVALPKWRKWMFAALVTCMVSNSTCVLLRMDVWEESSIEKASSWLVENNYTSGFATFWNSNIITALSDNKIEMWTVVPSWMPQWSGLTLYPHLQKKDHLEHLPEGKIFLLLTDYEDDADLPFSRGGREIYRFDGYSIYQYDSAEKLYETISTEP